MNKDNLDQATKNKKQNTIQKTTNIDQDLQNPSDEKKFFKSELNRKN